MAFTARDETYVQGEGLVDPYNATLPKPSGTVEGDILFAFISWYAVGVTIDSVPSGWTLLGSYTDNTDKYALYYKIAGDSEPANYLWSFSGSAKVLITGSCYTGGDFDADDPIDVVSNTAYRTSDTIVRAITMTVASANSPLVFFAAVSSSSSKSFTKPSIPTTDWIEDADNGSIAPDIWEEVCSMIWNGSAATGDMDATCSASVTLKHAFAVALNPITGEQVIGPFPTHFRI